MVLPDPAAKNKFFLEIGSGTFNEKESLNALSLSPQKPQIPYLFIGESAYTK
jgi:hypothetical protein